GCAKAKPPAVRMRKRRDVNVRIQVLLCGWRERPGWCAGAHQPVEGSSSGGHEVEDRHLGFVEVHAENLEHGVVEQFRQEVAERQGSAQVAGAVAEVEDRFEHVGDEVLQRLEKVVESEKSA